GGVGQPVQAAVAARQRQPDLRHQVDEYRDSQAQQRASGVAGAESGRQRQRQRQQRQQGARPGHQQLAAGAEFEHHLVGSAEQAGEHAPGWDGFVHADRWSREAGRGYRVAPAHGRGGRSHRLWPHPDRRRTTMRYRRLGGSGLKLSELSLGSWLTAGARLGRGEMRELVALAWDHGVNFFDSAENYAHGEAERVVGDVIADLRLPRDGFCVSSKVYFDSAPEPRPTQAGLSRKHVCDACHHALRRLRVDYLDLFFCHRPDPDTPVSETERAMDDLVRQGKVLYWGTSEWPATLIREAFEIARSHHLQPPTMEQPQYNLL